MCQIILLDLGTFCVVILIKFLHKNYYQYCDCYKFISNVSAVEVRVKKLFNKLLFNNPAYEII